MKDTEKYNDEENYEHPEIAWTIIGGVIAITILIHIYFGAFICCTGM